MRKFMSCCTCLRSCNPMRTFARAHAEGWFNETLPTGGMRRAGLAFIRLDGDLYASTHDALTALYPLLRRGGIVYVDDYGSFPGCARAIDEYRQAHTIHAPLHSVDEGNGRMEAVFWQKL